MALQHGTRIGPYQVTAQIGEGGMGQVYRATDSNLARTVAIKVLPDAFAQDADRVARFEREARMLAALNHPNIAHIYGLERTQNQIALVMELVDGPTLDERILRGAIPLSEALPIARQIAEALENAHELGIVHRDLKPANIKVRPDGTVKVLDFGLAKGMEAAASATPSGTPAPGAFSMSPTLTTPALLTGAGIILGTAAYMSPEQARGKAVDKRTDIWAFGCVLYEMLTGRRAFAGEDVTEVLARVLERDVDLTAIPATVPPAIRRLLRRCLAKDRRQRLSDIGVARLEIDEALTGGAPETPSVVSTESRSPFERAAWASAVVVAALIAAAVTFYMRPAPLSPAEVRFEIPVSQMRFLEDIAVSPDGSRVAFAAAAPNGRDAIWVRELSASTARLLPGTENATPQSMMPAWSADGRYIVFAADGNLKKADVMGGSAQTLTRLGGQLGGATWNRDNVIVFASNDHGLRRISASGGNVTAVSERDNSLEETYHDAPVFLPDGKHFLYLAWSNTKEENRAIFIGSLDSSSRTRLMTAESNATYSRGRLLFLRGETLVAQPFDPDRLQFTGDAVSVDVRVAKFGGELGAFSVSDTGTLIYREPRDETPTRQLVWIDRAGKTVRATDDEFPMGPGVRLSSSGNQIAFVEGNPPDVFVYDLQRRVKTRLTTTPETDHNPVWSPDGSRVVFDSHRTGPDPQSASDAGLYERPANGATAERPMLDREKGVQHSPRDWSADGNTLVFAKQGQNGRWNLWGLPLTGDRKPFPYRTSEFNENEAALSPNGRLLAFTSNESGRNEVIVQPFPDASRGRWQISSEGGSAPRWRRDGRELFYIDLKGRIVGLSVTTTDPTFSIQQTTLTLQTALPVPLQIAGSSAPYDVAPDGQRFLLTLPITGVSATPISVRLNWAALTGSNR
jgi:Tol biopolymer transport system component